ncbi:PREDICTED: geranylgeranyl transferase type-2 subunit alpha-like [Amphimedon queenslandica]|uniref:Geranylgeranyl transferase type-2 subunit alpha n=1 Tax=Amphimedon queenslandica TaxID=400682 RepID=A0A1X7VD38_AMPQE|nr:PREDICTED: geranylgeranyl transferase type-2 subunit alpha-like [Amphimedon queenslandica]|eukprot:XP_019849488.1 PREDICTED: geranylgeranyl transferase type-2 subunit alpha-like [Amphimedon queenslandica]
MHGRLKVRSTAEQEEARRREKEKKVLWYREKNESIFAKRAAGEKDRDTLKLTEEVLLENSDVGTLWSYRREILTELLPTCSQEDSETMCKTELNILERCLRVNPKAYCVWLHRRWVLEHSPAPQWAHEKQLCDLFLNHDERNFHCWDYRRYVIRKAGIPPSDEFKYSFDKIATNFSNHSAWHYRSKLLPLLHPSHSSSNGIDENAMKKEYELAQNAFYTDPSDQSAWFYHKWLLGRGTRGTMIGCVLVRRDPAPFIAVSFNQNVKSTEEEPIIVTLGDALPKPVTDSGRFESLWWSCDLVFPKDEEVTVRIEKGDGVLVEMSLDKGSNSSLWLTPDLDLLFSTYLTAATSEVLDSELVMCRELLQLEPDNKWCLLTTLQLLEAIDYDKHHKEIIDLYDKLVKCDPLRRGYYNDLRSRHLIAVKLRRRLEERRESPDINSFDLSQLNLSRLYFTQHMVFIEDLLLNGNKLNSTHSLEGLKNLKSLQSLSLADNQLITLPKTLGGLTNLKSLSLENNDIKELEDFDTLRSLPELKELNIRGNPVCQLSDCEPFVKKMLPNIKLIH